MENLDVSTASAFRGKRAMLEIVHFSFLCSNWKSRKTKGLLGPFLTGQSHGVVIFRVSKNRLSRASLSAGTVLRFFQVGKLRHQSGKGFLKPLRYFL